MIDEFENSDFDILIHNGRIFLKFFSKIKIDGKNTIVMDYTDKLRDLELKGEMYVKVKDGAVLIKMGSNAFYRYEKNEEESKNKRKRFEYEINEEENLLTVYYSSTTYKFPLDKIRELYERLPIISTKSDFIELGRELFNRRWSYEHPIPSILMNIFADLYGAKVVKKDRKKMYKNDVDLSKYSLEYEFDGDEIIFNVNGKEIRVWETTPKWIFDALPEKAYFADILIEVGDDILKAVALMKFFDRRAEFDASLLRDERGYYCLVKGTESEKFDRREELEVEKELTKEWGDV